MVRLSGTAEPAKRLELTEQLIRMVVVHAMTEETVNIARLWLKHYVFAKISLFVVIAGIVPQVLEIDGSWQTNTGQLCPRAQGPRC